MQAVEEFGFGRVLFVPTGLNPLKPPSGASPLDRLRMVELGIANNSKFSVSDIEVRRTEASFTKRTRDELVSTGVLSPDSAILIGADLLAELERWREWETLRQTVRFVVGRRASPTTSGSLLPARLDMVSNPELEISSSDIKERLRAGRSIRYLVPESVYDFIRNNDLYR